MKGEIFNIPNAQVGDTTATEVGGVDACLETNPALGLSYWITGLSQTVADRVVIRLRQRTRRYGETIGEFRTWLMVEVHQDS